MWWWGNMKAAAAPSYTANPVTYGSGDYLTLDASLAAGYKNFVLAVILRSASTGSGNGWIIGHSHFYAYKAYSWDVVRVTGLDSGGATVFDAQTYATVGYVPNDAWKCVLMSRTGTAVQVYVGDTSCADVVTNTDTAIAFDWQPPTVGLSYVPDQPYVGDFSLVGLALNQTLDLSVQANRRLFFDDNGIPVDPRNSGLTWTVLIDQAAASLANAGTGPTLTVTGTPTDSSNTPVDVL